MSITHHFKFDSITAPEQTLSNLLSSNLALRPATYDQMEAEGLFGRVSQISRISQQHLFEEFGFRANSVVTFDEDSDGDIEEARKVMGDAIALLLKQETGDAMFFYVFDTPILKRTNGTIKVIDEPDFEWLRISLNNANLNYETYTEQTIRQSKG